MPYYEKYHILFIHIPKTGGTSLEETLQENSRQSLFSKTCYNDLLPVPYKNSSLQHQSLRTLKRYKKLLPFSFDDKLRIISIVRNPYTRIVSALLWNKLISKQSSKDDVYIALNLFTTKIGFDNHNLKQIDFISDENGNLDKNVIVLKQETLNDDCENLLGLQIKSNSHKQFNSLYIENFLNSSSINLINRIYKEDFIQLGYSMII